MRLLLVVLALAGGVARADSPPPPVAVPPVVTPKVLVERLDNGLTVWLVPRPGVPKVVVELVVRGGLAGDPRGKAGLSELLAATVTEGTRGRSAEVIANELAAVGGELEASSSAERLTIDADVLSDGLGAALAVLADVATGATFPDKEVELARHQARDRLKQREAEPVFLARRAALRALFGDHPYATLAGSDAALAAITAAELRATHRRRFRPDQALLVLVGDLDGPAALASVRTAFGSWKAPAEPPPPAVAPAPAPTAPTVLLIPRPGSVQTELEYAARGPTRADPDYAAATVADTLFGHVYFGRLARNLREDKGYTYHVRSTVSARRRAGFVEAGAAVRTEVTGAALNELGYELRRFGTTTPPDSEVATAKSYVLGTMAMQVAGRGQLAELLAELWTNDLTPEAIGKLAQAVSALTAAELGAVGRARWAGGHWVIVGDEAAVRKELVPLGLDPRAAR